MYPQLESLLVSPVLHAPIDHTQLVGTPRDLLLFHLIDGTTVTRAYWLEAGILARDVQGTRLMLPKSFGQAIQAALLVKEATNPSSLLNRGCFRVL